MADPIPAQVALTLKRALTNCGPEVSEEQRNTAFAWVDEHDPTDDMGGM